MNEQKEVIRAQLSCGVDYYKGEKGDTPVKGVDYFTQADIDSIIEQIEAGDIDLTSYATKVYVDEAIAAIPEVDLTGYATETYVGDAIAAIDFPVETDPTVPEWAKAENKPTYTAAEVGALPANTVIPTVPTNVSAFTNDAGYLTSHQSLDNYATKSYVETAIAGIETGALKRSVVSSLPSTGIDENTIYMVAKSGSSNDIYDEYLYVNNAWEKIGSTAVDLTDYATKNYVDNAIADYATTEYVDNSISDMHDSIQPELSQIGMKMDNFGIGNGLDLETTDPQDPSTTTLSVKVDGSSITFDNNGALSAVSSSGGGSSISGITITTEEDEQTGNTLYKFTPSSSSASDKVFFSYGMALDYDEENGYWDFHSSGQIETDIGSMLQNMMWESGEDKEGKSWVSTIDATGGFHNSVYSTQANIGQLDVGYAGIDWIDYEHNKEEHITVDSLTWKNRANNNTVILSPGSGYDGLYVNGNKVATMADIPAAYSLPTATTSTLGGVKVDGSTITISNGVISAVASSSLPSNPSNDGTYFLKNVVSSGVATQSWENVVIGGSY